MKLPSSKRLGKIPRIFWQKFNIVEKVLIFVLVLVLVSDLFGAFNFLDKKTGELVPQKGGVIVEGVFGEPKFVNPLYAKTEVDKALSSLVFSGLVCYNKQRELSPCLAEKWEVSANQMDYKFFLKKGVLWHDGKTFSSEDVNYTVAVLQNPDYGESLKYAWEGVRLEKVDDYTVIFHLPKPYPLFLENLTVGILPSHLWVSIPVKDFTKSSLNINAVGTGPYKIEEAVKNKDGELASFKMVSNGGFSGGAPFIEHFEMKFYKTTESLIKGFKMREFSSFGLYSSDDKMVAEDIDGYNNYKVNLPQYVAVFFNLKKQGATADKSVRQAMAYAVDKSAINNSATFGAGQVINSPILPQYIGYNPDVKKYEFDSKSANTILNQAGWSDQNADGAKEKGDKNLIFDLVTLDSPQFVRVAEELSQEWAKIGVKINIKKADATVLEKDYVSKRDYDILLVGESLGNDSDPYSYWHSTQSNSPGLNFSGFQSGEADKILEESRQSLDVNIRVKNYKKFQDILADEVPAIFLYQPVYVYKVYDKVKGIDLSGIINTWDRFYSINQWFVKYKNRS